MNKIEICKHRREAALYAAGQLNAFESRAFESHMASCADCRRQAGQIRAMVGQLRELPEIPVAADFAERVWEKATRQKPASIHTGIFLKVAALFLVACGLGLFFLRGTHAPLVAGPAWVPSSPIPTPEQNPAVDKALAWLASIQEADGGWDAAKWGAQKNFDTAVTALALLAFLEAGSNPLENTYGLVLRRGLEHVARNQEADGRFGPFFSGTPYNQAFTTLVLAKAAALESNAVWASAAARGAQAIAGAQKRCGGWDYPRTGAESANSSVTVWQLLALMAAQSAGIHDAKTQIVSGLAWLEGNVDAEGRMGYRGPGIFAESDNLLTAAGLFVLLQNKTGSTEQKKLHNMLCVVRQQAADHQPARDAYGTFVLSRALEIACDGETKHWINKFREELQAQQVQTGPMAGSWDTADRWIMAGGKVYVTAMAVLTLTGDRIR